MHKAVLAFCVVASGNAFAAPLDAFLTANHPGAVFKPEFEVGYDLANRSVDFLGLRPKRADGTDGPAGDYSGGHIRVGVNLSPSTWIDGGLWIRKLDYSSVSADVTSWQIAAQHKLIEGGASGFSFAIRGGAWGNSSPELRKTSSAVVQGTTFTSAKATNPRDMQVQVDLIGTWPVAEGVELTGFVSGGRSRVDFDQVSATSKSKGGCDFDVQFTDTNVISTCDQNGATTRISVPNATYGIDVNQEARYSASFVSAGVNSMWKHDKWRLRGGFQYTALNRGVVDDIVASRGGVAYKANQFLLAEVGYKVVPNALAFVRAQVMAHQFVGEAALTYNTLTATQQRRRYGILTIGLVYAF